MNKSFSISYMARFLFSLATGHNDVISFGITTDFTFAEIFCQKHYLFKLNEYYWSFSLHFLRKNFCNVVSKFLNWSETLKTNLTKIIVFWQIIRFFWKLQDQNLCNRRILCSSFCVLYHFRYVDSIVTSF